MHECVPIIFMLRDNDLRVRWLRCSPAEFRDPFFQQSEERLINRALSGTVVETGMDALADRAGAPAPYPVGFIFHISLCGSTLLSNMLAQIPQHRMLSEPGAVSCLLDGLGDRLGSDVQRYVPALRATMNALGRWGGAPYFVKFSSQCARQIPMIRRAMPGVPEIFLYRSPLEVLVGNLRAPTQSWLWQEKHTGVPLAAALERPLVELLARGIGRSMQGLLDHLTDSTLLMNYSEIGPDTPQALLDAFGIPAADEVRAAMAATLVLDAKDALKQKLFQRDIETKRAAATAMQRDLIAEFADGPYRALEARRLARRGIATAVASAMPTLTHTGPISSRST